jgi:hypothetical protein
MAGIQLQGRNGQLARRDRAGNEGAGRGSSVSTGSAHPVRKRGPGHTLGEVIDSLRAGQRSPPGGHSVRLSGESRELEESGGALYFAFILALTVVFMVLASQFESLVHPFTVLLAVPLAVAGAIFTLKLTGSTLNLYSQIGMILLIGLVTKNSILLVEYQPTRRAGRAGGAESRGPARPILLASVRFWVLADRPRRAAIPYHGSPGMRHRGAGSSRHPGYSVPVAYVLKPVQRRKALKPLGIPARRRRPGEGDDRVSSRSR